MCFVKSRWFHLSLTAILGGLYLFAAASRVIEFQCPFTQIGFKCAGCGFTRAVLATWELDFERAFRANQAFVLIIQTTVTIAWIYASRLEKEIPETRYLAVLLGAFMIWRNLVG